MQQIGNVVKSIPMTNISACQRDSNLRQMKPNSQTMSTPSKANKQVSKRTEFIFARFASHYDNLWISKYKGESFLMSAKREWDERLMRFSDRVIKETVEMFVEQCEYPPNLSQMVINCKKAINRHTVFKPKTINVAKKEVGNFYLKQMYQYLSINKEI